MFDFGRAGRLRRVINVANGGVVHRVHFARLHNVPSLRVTGITLDVKTYLIDVAHLLGQISITGLWSFQTTLYPLPNGWD